ncbi:PadR family transcriptional regulator [Komarekiella sp. 'clone 1']|uniref:PadR family transcriptional regulator n=1 Tax=Komarekiella delphini-convector SJRDD-AB1 TaxID=2593771 RepID=A0AA40VQX4_9NOST|nr:PadR family transcriptional regulator [Komarekiella delphini-convector]MBD6616470.1 PadR family transcriptional regulator [Komarekiella delphini-convector SJRDD-AB1]
MFRHFRSGFPAPAWAGVSEEDSWLSYWFQHGKHHDRHHGKHFGDETFGRGWGDESRTRRGDIKFILLELLSEHPSHGYDLIKEMETRYGGFRRLSPGSVYPTLQMLEEGGYLRSAQEGGKRIYTITDEGRQLLAERTQKETTDSSWETFKTFMAGKPQELIELRKVATELAGIMVQVARSGNVDRINRVRGLLEQVKREIYAILAEK